MYKMLFLDVCDVFCAFWVFLFVTSNVYLSFLFKELNSFVSTLLDSDVFVLLF